MVAKKFVGTAAVAALLVPSLPSRAANVDITVTGLGGTRQFSVEDLTGAPLTALDLGTGGSKPFRTHVADSGFLPLSAASDDYSVTATMSNLYLKTGASTYNYAVSIPSSDLKIGFGSDPLAGAGITVQDLPKLSLSGTLAGCASLPTAVQTALGLSTLPLNLGAVIDPTNTALSTLCSTLNSSGTHTLAATVDGVVQNLVPVVSSVLDLPSQLGGATGGTFTNASYAAGTVGAGDTVGAGGKPAPTAVSLMTGKHNLSSGLIAAIKTALDNTLAGLPLVSATTGTATRSTVDAVVAGLSTTGNTVGSQLANALSGLSAANKVTVLNGLGFTSSALDPVLANISGITGNYYSLPILTATPNTPVAGSYGGTMTVTFVQS